MVVHLNRFISYFKQLNLKPRGVATMQWTISISNEWETMQLGVTFELSERSQAERQDDLQAKDTNENKRSADMILEGNWKMGNCRELMFENYKKKRNKQ